MGLETDRNLATEFELHTPLTVAEAVELLDRLDDTVVMSGGQSLTVLLTLGFAVPDHVVSIARCDELRSVEIHDTRLTIGALTTVADLVGNEVIAGRCPLLHQAASSVGSPHVRNFGTVVGNLCHADPGGDLLGPMLCLDAEVELTSAHGQRWIALDEFVSGPYSTSIMPGELATAARFDLPSQGWRQRYQKVARRQGDLALASFAVLLRTEGDTVSDARLSIGGVVGRAQRLASAEASIIGQQIVDAGPIAARAALDQIDDELMVDPDDPGSRDYLRELVRGGLHAAIAEVLPTGPREVA